MPLYSSRQVRSIAGWLSLSCGCAFALLLVLSYAQKPHPFELAARLLPEHMRNASEWKTISAEEVASGTEVPVDTNVIFTIGNSVENISRRTLFGRVGETVRYWGFCFPKDYEEADRLRKSGLPGHVFLSEAERVIHEPKQNDIRFAQARSIKEHQSNKEQHAARNKHVAVKDTKPRFQGGDVCFLMVDGSTGTIVRMGLDDDSDGLNNEWEKHLSTNPNNPDTDGDGIPDGIERHGELGTDPIKRDTDNDGLMDGIEDANGNGRRDEDETDPTNPDTDYDTLCDGLCPDGDSEKLVGEDVNLNGVQDEGETSPLIADTDGDSLRDQEEFYFCLIFGGTDCSNAS